MPTKNSWGRFARIIRAFCKFIVLQDGTSEAPCLLPLISVRPTLNFRAEIIHDSNHCNLHRAVLPADLLFG